MNESATNEAEGDTIENSKRNQSGDIESEKGKEPGEEKILSLATLAPFKNQIKSSPSTKSKTPFSRTPSGNILTGQVVGIKQFLQEKTNKTCSEVLGPDGHDQKNPLACASNCENAFNLTDFAIDHDQSESVNKKRKHIQSPNQDDFHLHYQVDDQREEILQSALTPRTKRHSSAKRNSKKV